MNANNKIENYLHLKKHYRIVYSLKIVSAIFIKFLFFRQMIDLQKLWQMLFMSSKKLFSFSK